MRIAHTVSFRDTFFVGAAQALALIPGFSRSGATMAGGLLVGLSNKDAARFAFLLATPIIGAAALLKIPDLLGPNGDGVRGQALVASLCAALTAYLSVRFLMRFFETNTLIPFAIYCLIAGLRMLRVLRVVGDTWTPVVYMLDAQQSAARPHHSTHENRHRQHSRDRDEPRPRRRCPGGESKASSSPRRKPCASSRWRTQRSAASTCARRSTGSRTGSRSSRSSSRAGVAMLNPPAALQLAHDKLATAGALAAASLPHPRTRTIFSVDAPAPVSFPLVVKPRFGSWGRDVMLCPDEPSYRRALDVLRTRAWFAATGAVAQELVPPLGHDLRVVIAAGDVIGAVKRVAPAGEWRTNVALGATRVRTDPSPAACELAHRGGRRDRRRPRRSRPAPGRPGTPRRPRAQRRRRLHAGVRPGGDVYAAAMRALVSRLRSEPVLPLEPLEALGAGYRPREASVNSRNSPVTR